MFPLVLAEEKLVEQRARVETPLLVQIMAAEVGFHKVSYLVISFFSYSIHRTLSSSFLSSRVALCLEFFCIFSVFSCKLVCI